MAMKNPYAGAKVPIIGQSATSEPPLWVYDSSLGVLVFQDAYASPPQRYGFQVTLFREEWHVDPIGMARLPRIDVRAAMGAR